MRRRSNNLQRRSKVKKRLLNIPLFLLYMFIVLETKPNAKIGQIIVLDIQLTPLNSIDSIRALPCYLIPWQATSYLDSLIINN